MISFLKRTGVWLGFFAALFLFAVQPVQAEKPLLQQTSHPLLVEIHADWCPACDHIEPTLQRLKKAYQGKVTFVTLDVTNRRTAVEARKTAKELGLEKWFEMNRSKTGLVAIINNGQVVKTYIAQADDAQYKKVLDQLTAK